MNFTVLTIFPEMFDLFWDHGIIRRAISKEKITATAINIRNFAEGRHRVTDDRPYGGGCGMVMKPEPLARAIRAVEEKAPASKRILLTPQGRIFDQKLALELAGFESLILVCGRYEGVDERVNDRYIDYEIYCYREKIVRLVYQGDWMEYYINNGASVVRKFSHSPEVLWLWNSGMSLLLMGSIKIISLLVELFYPLPSKRY